MKKLWIPLSALVLTTTVFVLVNADIQEIKPGPESLVSSVPDNWQNCMISLPDTLAFAGEPVPLDDPEVRERLDRELHINAYWHSSTFRILKNGHRWSKPIRAILKENQVPEDFLYLVAAESGFQNVASPAGAAGFWQILKSTGKEYGLIINQEVDQRYDPEKATQAACRYLKEAYGKFHNWTLVAASYNMGMGSLKQQLEKQRVSSYYDLYLNDETSRYVFRILALKLILSDPGAYHFCFDEQDLYQPVSYRRIVVDSTIDNLVDFALEQGTTFKMLKYLNPWLRGYKLTVPPDEQFELHLPS